jgi:hypothetical protein
MAFKGAATWVSMVLFLVWTMVHADDSYPTELDFKVAYCDGAPEASLQSPMSKLTVALHDLLTKRKQHFATYLDSRAYVNRQDVLSLAHAMAQGRADLQLTEASSERWVKWTPSAGPLCAAS